MARPQLPALTGLRFFAAMQIVVFHCTQWEKWPVRPWVRSAAASGFVAVSLFFVLSGFILTYVHAAPGAPPLDRRDFYSSRFARIYPAYAFALLVVAPLFTVHTIRLFGVRTFIEQSVAVATLLQAHVPRLALAWNPPAWSLSAEAFFYALFPLVAPPLVTCRRTTAIGVGIGCYAVSLAAAVLYLWLRPDAPVEPTHVSKAFWLGVLRYSPVVRFPEFVCGIVLGRCFLDVPSSTLVRRAARWGSLAALGALVAALGCGSFIPYPLLHNGLLVPIFATLIVSLAVGAGPLAALLGTRPVVALGDASYSLYLLHVPLMIIWNKCLAVLGWESLFNTSTSTGCLLGIAIVSSLLCHRFIEVPLRARMLALLRRGVTAPA